MLKNYKKGFIAVQFVLAFEELRYFMEMVSLRKILFIAFSFSFIAMAGCDGKPAPVSGVTSGGLINPVIPIKFEPSTPMSSEVQDAQVQSVEGAKEQVKPQEKAPTAVSPQVNTSKGETPKVQEPQKLPPGTKALCKDGTYTSSASKENACRKNGGVAQWL